MRALDLNVEEMKEQLDQNLLEDYAQRFGILYLLHTLELWLPSLDGHLQKTIMLL
jgi:hypothetical protein